MLALLAVHSAVSQNTAEKDGFNPRIYYGDDAEKGEFPFMVRCVEYSGIFIMCFLVKRGKEGRINVERRGSGVRRERK